MRCLQRDGGPALAARVEPGAFAEEIAPITVVVSMGTAGGTGAAGLFEIV